MPDASCFASASAEREKAMFERVDVYVKRGGRWVYHDCSRARKTLAATERLFAVLLGEPVKCRWSER
jgi:hypothetical protein